jgi:hypothetical protein
MEWNIHSFRVFSFCHYSSKDSYKLSSQVTRSNLLPFLLFLSSPLIYKIFIPCFLLWSYSMEQRQNIPYKKLSTTIPQNINIYTTRARTYSIRNSQQLFHNNIYIKPLGPNLGTSAICIRILRTFNCQNAFLQL